MRSILKIKVENEFLNGIYKDLAKLVGDENAQKIYLEYRGQQITFPVELYSKQYIYIYNRIIAEYDGTNLKQLATKYGCSERTIRRMIENNELGKFTFNECGVNCNAKNRRMIGNDT